MKFHSFVSRSQLELAHAGGEGAEEAAKRYERWELARKEELKKKADEALAEMNKEFD